MTQFSLRPMEPTDGAAMDALMRAEAQTSSFRITTHHLHDVYRVLEAQHADLIGVVAESAGMDGLVGMATAFMDEVTVADRSWPSAHLENLKVRHDVRRQGLGRRLAAWRIEQARRGFGGEGVIVTGVESGNAASLATAATWATQVLGPVRIVIGSTTSKAPPSGGLEVRPPADSDVEAVVDGVNAFHVEHLLFPRQSPERLAASLAPTSLGEPIRQYRVAVTAGGDIVAGALVTERFKLMVDHIDSVPLPLAILGRVTGQIPSDRFIRSIELSLAWHAPGRLDGARQLWAAVRQEWHGRCTNVVALADQRGSLAEAFGTGHSLAPRLALMAPVMSPVTLDDRRLLYMWR